MLPVHPSSNNWTARKTLTLRHLILVMRKYVVNTTRMNVELVTEILHRHGGALYMPTGKPITPRRGPFKISARFRCFPESKIARVVLEGVIRVKAAGGSHDIEVQQTEESTPSDLGTTRFEVPYEAWKMLGG